MVGSRETGTRGVDSTGYVRARSSWRVGSTDMLELAPLAALAGGLAAWVALELRDLLRR
jgi:hypothetical protein